MHDADPDPDELPDDLADRAAEQFMTASGPQRGAALEALLAVHPERAAGLSRLWAELAATDRLLDAEFPDADASSPAHIGGHRVLRRLGEGAFGIVYLCAQEQPVVRQVAIKVLRPGAGDDKTLRRFAAERQLLATLNHPAITQVFDAGQLPDGRPFFVMEYVDGPPIRRYCEERGLSCRERLHLFIDLCRGVAHAHKRGIVHRDLTPANVLVVETDHGPMPKIIDFGIAKALFASDDAAGLRTDAGRVIGTPGYMSPEQAAGRSNDTDERADVFALGVMLYELLTGELPWARGAAATDTEPLRPSARITTSTSAPTAPPSQRRQRVAEVRGDLDWITLKALARERDQRYATVTDLLGDIERHLRGEAVSVGPPSVTYRLRKALWRHRTVFAWASACLLTLAVGTAVAWQLRVEVMTSEEARLTAVAEAVSRLQQRATSPAMEGASDDLRKEILSDALALHERELRGRPERVDLRRLRVKVLNNLAWTCYYLGQYRQAIVFADEAWHDADELQRLEPCDLHRRAGAIALREIGRSHFMIGEFEAARAASASAIATFEQLHERDPMASAMLLSGALGEYAASCGHLNNPDAQLAAQERAVSVLQDYAAERPDDAEAQRNLVRVQCGMAHIMMARQQLDAAEAALLKAESLVQSLPLVTDEERSLVDLRLGKFYAAKGEPGKAVQHAERAAQLTAVTLARQPGKQQQRVSMVLLHELLFEQHRLLGDEAAARMHAEAVLGMRDEPNPEIACEIAALLINMARPAIDAKTMAGFERADALLARSLEHLASVDEQRRRVLRVEALAARGHVLHELGRPWPVARWDEVVSEAEATEESAWAAFAALQRSQCRLMDLDLDGARADLTAAGRADGDVPPGDLAQQALAIELAGRDHAAAARAAQRLVSIDPSIIGKIGAAIGCTQACSLASRGDIDAQRAANAYRASAIALCQQIAATDEQSQLHVLARAQAGVCLAELTTADGQAGALRAEHLPVLDGLRDHVPASWWNESLWLSAHMAWIRSALDEQRATDALAALEALMPRLRSPLDLVEVCALCVECLETAVGGTAGSAPAAAGRAELVALEALRRAVDGGLRGRRRVLDRADLLPLHASAAFQGLVGRIPD